MKTFYLVTSIIISGVFANSAQAAPSVILPTDSKVECTLDQTTFNSDWAKIHFPKGSLLNTLSNGKLASVGPVYDDNSGMVYVFPANGPEFTEHLSGDYKKQSTNCSFFKWSSQMFLWLTSTVSDTSCNGKKNCSWPNNTPSSNTDYVFASEFFYRLEDNKTKLVVQGAGNTPADVRAAKTDNDNDTVAQAGSDGVLFLTPAEGATDNGTEPLVFYSIHTNRPFGYVRAAETQTKTQDLFSEFPADHESICQALIYGFTNDYSGTAGNQGAVNAILLLNFCADIVVEDILAEIIAKFESTEVGPVLNGLVNNDPEARRQAAEIIATSGQTIPSLEMAIDYLSMAMEVKASWVPSWVLADKTGYILHKANLPTYTKQTDGSLLETGSQQTEVALVGMHVVGSVKGHPEMIWSTFEHYKNAPNATYAYLAKSGETKYHSDRFIADAPEWLLNNGSMAELNREYATFVKTQQSDGTKSHLIEKNSANNDLDTANNVMRLSPWGSLAESASAKTNSELISTNAQVLAAIKEFYKDQGIDASKDPRMNYMLTGSSWGSDGKFPTFSDSPLTKNISGTPAMENSTLETFTQSFGTSMNTSGCFGCHAVTKSNEKPSNDWKFDVSHIFDKIKEVGKNKNANE